MCTPEEGSMHLKKMRAHFLSSDVITPGSLPRQTQPNFGMYLAYDDKNYIPRTPNHLPEAILEKHSKKNKEFWVRPQKETAWEVWNMHRDHYVEIGPKATQESKFQFFPRTYSFELACLQHWRLKQGYEMLKGQTEICKRTSHEKLEPPPFITPDTWTQGFAEWPVKFTPEDRRRRMSKWGQPFQSEAIGWYSEHYPAPTLPLLKPKFAKMTK